MTNTDVAGTEATSSTQWRWLDGPSDFCEPDSSLRDLAAALATQVRVPLAYGDWACVLQSEDSANDRSEAGHLPSVRRYELSFWIDYRPARPGEPLGPPGVFVESLERQSDGQFAQADERDAIARLLGRAAAAVDARSAPSLPADLKRPGMTAEPAHPRANSGPRRFARRYALAALATMVAVLLVPGFIARPYAVHAVSIDTSPAPREEVLVDRMIYRFRSVHRGDLVVFDDPRAPHAMLLTKVVGLPGDLLSLRSGYLFVDGVRIDEALTGEIAFASIAPLNTGDQAGPRWTSTHPYRLPAGEYFVASDDPAGHFGSLGGVVVPHRAIVGQAVLSFWPLGRAGRT